MKPHAALLSLLLLSGCAHVADELDGTAANRIARPAFMVERTMDTGTSPLKLWERMHTRGAPANIYIGEGGSTPSHALGLHLASRDLAGNLGWIAQPCQFHSPSVNDGCKNDNPVSGNAVAAFNAALDDIKARYDITGFNLIGYDTGASVAAHLAAARTDVLSLRTVAGALDTAHGIAPALRTVPQFHFIAAGDQIVPPAIYHNFRQAQGESSCVRYAMIQDADHRKGWVEVWPKLLKLAPSCSAPAANAAAAPQAPVATPPLFNPYTKEAVKYDAEPLPPSPHKDQYRK